MEEPKSRKRNLEAAEQLAAKPKQSWVLRLLKLIFLPLIWLFKWLNQPVKTHADFEENSLLGELAKQRSVAPAYVRNSFAEVKQVNWPTFPAAMRLTFAVFFFATFFALVVTGLDWVLTQIFEELILNKAENLRNLF